MTGTNISRQPSFRNPPIYRVMLLEFLNPEFEDYRSRGPKAIAHLYAFARMTQAEVSAVLVSQSDQVYELLFSFLTLASRLRFLEMLHANESTDCPEGDIMTPGKRELDAAKPIAEVLPAPMMREAIITHAMLAPVHGLPN
jgi:hypothetical protein